MGFLVRGALGVLGLGLAGWMGLAPQDAGGNGAPPTAPLAQDQNFDTLDAYLAHLKQLGPMGITWYQRRPDGRYTLVQRRPPGQAPQIFTRQELLERYGFER